MMHIASILQRTAWLAAIVVCAAPAMAAPQTTYLTTYLRVGPGEQFAAVDELDPHSQVEVQSCEKGWCSVQSGRVRGFIRADVLSAPDIHAKPGAPAADATCVTARLNGRPRGGDDLRVCSAR